VNTFRWILCTAALVTVSLETRGGGICPPEGAALNYTHVRFEWTAVPGAITYDLQVVVDDGSPDPFSTALPVVDLSVAAAPPSTIVASGLEFATSYAWRVRGDDGAPLPWGATNRFDTAVLPAIPTITVTTDPNHPNIEPGLTLFGIRSPAGLLDPSGLAVAVDQGGAPVWFMTFPTVVRDLRLLDSGRISFISDTRGWEIDLDGNVTWASPDDPNLSVHHELFPMPSGNFMALLYEFEDVFREVIGDLNMDGAVNITDLGLLLADFGCAGGGCAGDVDGDGDTSITDVGLLLGSFGNSVGGLQLWRGDRIVEFDRATNQLVWDWRSFDNLSTDDFDAVVMSAPGSFGAEDNGSYDWTHANAVVYDAADDGVYLSARHLSRIVRIDYTTQQIVYQMGFDMPSGDVDFGDNLFSFQHAPELLPNGNMLLFDNGNRRDHIVQTVGVSKAVELAFSGAPTPTSASIVWEYTLPAYAALVGDADRLPGGNTLITSGPTTTLFEVDTAGNEVWKLELPAGLPNYLIYRAERIANLYPVGP
jgi:hypothetical protein